MFVMFLSVLFKLLVRPTVGPQREARPGVTRTAGEELRGQMSVGMSGMDEENLA